MKTKLECKCELKEKKYQLIANEIKKRILNETYKANELMPEQGKLAKEFGVSKITIKKALDGLARAGLIYKKSGLGTYVLGQTLKMGKLDSPANAFDGLYHQQGKKHIKSKVILFEPEFPSAHVAQKLNITTTELVYNIKRLRIIDGMPFILEHTYMPVSIVPKLPLESIKSSIYSYIHDELNLKFGGAFRKIHSDWSNQDDVKYLETNLKVPMLEVEQVVWLANGKYVEYSKSRNVFNTRAITVVDINNF